MKKKRVLFRLWLLHFPKAVLQLSKTTRPKSHPASQIKALFPLQQQHAEQHGIWDYPEISTIGLVYFNKTMGEQRLVGLRLLPATAVFIQHINLKNKKGNMSSITSSYQKHQ